MTHPRIEEVPLYPRRVGFFCANAERSRNGQTWHGNRCDVHAVAWLVSDGRAIARQCRRCLDRALRELEAVEPGGWTEAPLYHDGDQNLSQPRTDQVAAVKVDDDGSPYPCPECGNPVDVQPESPYNECGACGAKSAVDGVNPF